MPRDYAQRGARRSQTQQKGALPAWVWLVFGLSMGLVVAAFVYISRPATALPGQTAETAKPQPPPPAGKKAGGKSGMALPPAEPERFSFYKELKKQKVYIPRDELPPVKKPAAPQPELYMIQVASYRAVSDAENLKANLALLGIETRIEKVSVDDTDTYFRVRAGPLPRERAESILARLDENGLDGMMVRAN